MKKQITKEMRLPNGSPIKFMTPTYAEDFYSAENKSGRKGFLHLVKIDDSGNVKKQTHAANLVTKQGADCIAKLIGRDDRFWPTFMYGEHVAGGTYTEGVIPPLTATREDKIDVMRASGRDTVDAEVAIPVPTFTTSNAVDYEFNVVNFQGTFGGAPLVGRQMIGAGLVARVGTAEYLFAHSYFPASTLNTGENLFVFWSVNIL